MGASVVDAIVRGHRGAWVVLFVAVAIAAIAALLARGTRVSAGRVLGLSGLVTVLAAGGVLAAMGLAVPKLVWRAAPPPPFVNASGEVWRALRAPATTLLDAGKPEIGVAGVDAGGKVRLFGLFSGAPLDAYPAAGDDPPRPGGPRICRTDKEECRAWPQAWPEPSAALSGSDFVWTRDLTPGALAYDVESNRFLHHVEGLRVAGDPVAMAGSAAPVGSRPSARATAGTWALELVGKFTNEPSHDAPTALFVVRRVVDGRLDAARVVATPAGQAFTFAVERASTSLVAGPSALSWFARPLLFVLVLWLPFVTIAFQAAPAWWASRRRKLLAEGKEVPEMPSDPAAFSRAARLAMAQRLHGLAVLAVGLALAAPAVVAVASILGAR
jgi:hypothetical protein